MKKLIGWFLILLPFIAVMVVCSIVAATWVFFAALGITIVIIGLLFLGFTLIDEN